MSADRFRLRAHRRRGWVCRRQRPHFVYSSCVEGIVVDIWTERLTVAIGRQLAPILSGCLPVLRTFLRGRLPGRSLVSPESNTMVHQPS